MNRFYDVALHGVESVVLHEEGKWSKTEYITSNYTQLFTSCCVFFSSSKNCILIFTFQTEKITLSL